MTCSNICPTVKTVCFGLNFYDDTVPTLTLESDTTGPRVGGDIVRLTISNFPYEVVSVYYEMAAERVFIDQVSLFSKGSDAMGVIINTPEFVGFVGNVDIILEPTADASKSVGFSYLVEDVRPEVVSTNPVQGNDGTKIMVGVQYFEYPTEVFIRINDGDPLPDDKVDILPMSNKHMTLFNIEWMSAVPAVPGTYEVVISPKACPEACDKSVRFLFEELDDSLPEFVSEFGPIPKTGSYRQSNLPVLYVSMRETSAEISNIMVHFLNPGGESRSVHVDSSAMTLMTPNRNLKVSQLTIPMPSFISTGDFDMTVKLEMVNGQNKTAAPIPLTFFDGLLPRVVEIKPTSVPTSALISGRKLELKSTVAVTFANLPQENMGIAEIAARLKLSAKPVSVVSVKHIVTCLSSGSNCNRTQIVFELPGMDSPGDEKLGITWTNALESKELVVELEFQPPCDVGYDRFCQDKRLITNFQLLEAKPTIACSTDYCIDPATIRNPAVLDFSPKEGPVSGGTLLTVWLKDLPAFSASDVSVQVVGSTSSSSTQVVSLSQSPTSTLKNGKQASHSKHPCSNLLISLQPLKLPL